MTTIQQKSKALVHPLNIILQASNVNAQCIEEYNSSLLVRSAVNFNQQSRILLLSCQMPRLDER
jgi:hypothetical protein